VVLFLHGNISLTLLVKSCAILIARVDLLLGFGYETAFEEYIPKIW
jgi:hypothetical protein